MAERKVRINKKGQKVITRTKQNGVAVKKTLSAKGEDGKRTSLSKTTKRTNGAGDTVTKRTGASGRKTVTRAKANGVTTERKTNAKGKIVGSSRTKTADGTTKTTSKDKSTAKVAGLNKIKKATTETKGRAGRVKRLQERKKARAAAGKSTANLQKKIGTTKKKLTSNIRKRRKAKSES